MGILKNHSATRLYQIEFRRTDCNTAVITATNRHGRNYVCWIIRDKNNWFSGDDFASIRRVTFKGIILEFLRLLNEESRLFDERFYRFKRYTTHDNGATKKPMTWEGARVEKIDNEPEPTFNGGFTLT